MRSLFSRFANPRRLASLASMSKLPPCKVFVNELKRLPLPQPDATFPLNWIGEWVWKRLLECRRLGRWGGVDSPTVSRGCRGPPV